MHIALPTGAANPVRPLRIFDPPLPESALANKVQTSSCHQRDRSLRLGGIVQPVGGCAAKSQPPEFAGHKYTKGETMLQGGCTKADGRPGSRLLYHFCP